MSSEHRTLGKLYPRSQDPKELADKLTEHARQHEYQLQTNVAAAGRFKALEDRVKKLEETDTSVNAKLTEIAVGIGKVKGAMWALGLVWVVGVAVAGFLLGR